MWVLLKMLAIGHSCLETGVSGEEETRRSSTLALDTLSHLASTCYGPAGRSKIVRANASGGGLTVTSTSHKLFSALALHEPIAKVVLELLIARQAKGADGGLFTVLLTTGLLRGAWRSGLPPRVVAALVPEALARCAAYARCGSLAGRLRISHLPTLLALVRGVLAPKHVALPAGDHAALQQLCVLVVSAFVRAVPRAAPLPDSSRTRAAEAAAAEEGLAPAARRAARLLPALRQLPLVGRHVRESELIDGVLLDLPSPPRLAELASLGTAGGRPVRVALYVESLHAVLPGSLGALATLECGGGEVAALASEEMLRRFADGVAAAGVSLLLCQKLVAPALLRLLDERNVLVLPRLSLRHIGAAKTLSGAAPLAQLLPPKAGELGLLGGVRPLPLGAKEYIHLLPPAASAAAASVPMPPHAEPVCTLVLWAPHATASEELRLCVSCALATLASALCEPRPAVLPGGGAFEVIAAARLRRDAARLCLPPPSPPPGAAEAAAAAVAERQRRSAWLLVAEALEAAAVALARNGDGGGGGGGGGGAAGTGFEVLEAMREANAAAIACGDHGGVAGDHGELATQGSGCAARDGRSTAAAAQGVGPPSDRARALPIVPMFGWDVETAAPREVLSLRRVASTARAGSERSSESSSGGDSSGDGGGEDDEAAGGSSGGGGLSVVVEAYVAELASAKLEAMQASVEIACALMGADGILVDAR